MKICLSFLVFIISLKTITAQSNYTPLNIGLGHYWINHYKVVESGFTLAEGDVITYFEKDTIIKSTPYHKLKNQVLHEDIPSVSMFNHLSNVPIYLREDTLLRRVNRLFSSSLNEIFYLNYFMTVHNIHDFCNTVVMIDSIYVDTYAGIPRKTYQYSSLPSNGFFIEGIGATMNFPLCIVGDWKYYQFELKCAGKGNQILYMRYPTDTCTTNLPLNLSSSSEKDKLFEWYVNRLTLHDPQNIKTVKIMTLDGKMVYCFSKQINQPYLTIPENLPTGMYIVQMSNSTYQQIEKICITNKD